MSTNGMPFHANLRGVFVGSGSDGMSDPRMARVILDLATQQQQQQRRQSKDAPINVMYLGTATYDLPQFAQRQTQCFLDDETNNKKSVMVTTLDLVHRDPPPAELEATIGAADIIVVGGGNTLYAVDRWHRVGGSADSSDNLVPKLLRQAMERGAVLTGGSAGAICWFDGGHSDSMDPDTYYPAMQAKFGSSSGTSRSIKNLEESSAAPDSSEKKDWNYIRVPGLGFLPGIVCPHHDRIQSNGLLRAHDFDQMLLRQYQQQNDDDKSGEIGIGIDHWAALVIDGDDSFRVVSLEDKPGSVLVETSSFSPDAKGVPGVWIKRVVKGKVVSTLLPSSGKISEVFQRRQLPIQDDMGLEQCRRDNPDQGPIRKAVE